MQECLFCGSAEHHFVFEGRDRQHPVDGTYEVHRCVRCGLLFLNPQPSPEELAEHYPSTYYSLNGDRSWDARDERLYAAFHKGGLLDRLSCLPYRPWMRTVIGGPGTRLLDVGCGSGHFLSIAKKVFGVDAYGVEPHSFDPEYAERNGIKVVHGTLQQAAFPDEFFDVITLNHVLEHLSNPRAVLEGALRVLKPNGTLVIAVPNGNSPLFRIFGKRWYSLDVPRHLFIPSLANLKQLAADIGFRAVKVRYTGTSESILGSLFYCLDDALNRSKYLGEQTWSRNALTATLPFAVLLNLLHLGDYMELQFTKA